MALALAFGGWFALVTFFFGRRIGGAGGGSEKNIVGVLWLVVTIALALVIAFR